MNKNQLLKRLGLGILTGVLGLATVSCNNSGSNTTQSSAGSQLVADTVSAIPLVNGNPASYSVYIKNTGKTAVS